MGKMTSPGHKSLRCKLKELINIISKVSSSSEINYSHCLETFSITGRKTCYKPLNDTEITVLIISMCRFVLSVLQSRNLHKVTHDLLTETVIKSIMEDT